MGEQPSDDPKGTSHRDIQQSDQSGGVNIIGGENIFHGDVTGRDKIVYSAGDLNIMFKPLIEAIQQAPPEKQHEAQQKVAALKEEVAKGNQAEDSRMAKLIDEIVELVPGAVSAVVSMFATPVLGGLVGPVTKFVLDKFRNK